MKIEGLDYNTRRQKLQLPEYGREIQKMVEHAMKLEDREERQICAENIVSTMQRIFPLSGDRENDTHKFWDHLAIMSDFKLDIDNPSMAIWPKTNLPNPTPFHKKKIKSKVKNMAG